MGYKTQFRGAIKFNKRITPLHKAVINQFGSIRHDKRKIELLPEDPLLKLAGIELGKDGKFFCGTSLKKFFSENKLIEIRDLKYLKRYYLEIGATILHLRNEKYPNIDKNIFHKIIKKVLTIDEEFIERHFNLNNAVDTFHRESIVIGRNFDEVPGIWCDWCIEDEVLIWNGSEKFYNYTDWLKFLIKHFFKA